MRIWVVLIFLAVFSYNIPNTDTCVLPTDLRGTWIDTFKGALEIEDSRITGYKFHTFGTLTLTCYQQDDNLYIMESTEFLFYGLNFTAYFCWNFTQVNTDMFFFYEYAAPVADAGYERAKVYLPTLPRIYDSICANPDVGLGTYRIMFRNGTIEDAITDCPPQINGNYKYDIKDETGASTCNSSSNPLDACTNSTALQYNGTDCSIPLAYSDSGSVFCLFNVEDSANKIHYMSLYNPGDVDESRTFSITCMIMNYASSSLKATQYPRQCPDDMNTTYVTSPGAYVYLKSPSSCSSSSEFPWWIIGVVVGIFFLIAAIIFYFFWRKKREEEKEKQRLLQQEDDERFDPDKFARGDRPPFVSITIMGDGRKRDKDGNIIPDEPPKIKRPKSEGGKRRLDKRKRVWVIGKDGQVKKVWKEAGESPDSGVEDDEVDGSGGGGVAGGDSTGRKTLSSSGTGEQEDDDLAFAKKHGRKELKSAREIEEKGEKDKNSAKLMRKMKGMVSSRRSARFRKSARSGRRTGRKKSAPYKDDDGERSWGSDDGDYEEVDVDQIPEVDDNVMNEEREKLGDDFVKPAAAVTMLSETDSKEGSKGKKGMRDKGKQKAGKEEQGEEPSVSGVPATAVVVDETAEGKKEKETSKKPQTNKKSQKKVESKQTKKASDKKLPSGRQEHIEMEDKKAVSFREGGDDGKLSGGGKAAIGAGTAVGGAVAAAVAVLAKDSEKDKTETQLKAEQKKKDKEEAKRQKEEKKRMEKEAKEAKKNADADAKEKAKALTRYASVDESKNETKDEESNFSEKKDDLKPAGNDSGHVTPTSADNLSKLSDTAPNSSRKETDKIFGDATDEKPPPPPPPREPTLSSSLRPRREQSVLLELDNSRSGSAGITSEKRDSNESSTSQGQKRSMEVVEELVDTARSKAEGLDNTVDESIAVAPAVVPLLDLVSINESVKADSVRGDEEKEDKKRKEKDIKDEKRKTVGKEEQQERSKTGAKTTDKQKDTPSQGVQIRVTEAEVKLKAHHETIQEEDGESEGSDDSSEPDVPVVRRKKPQGFMFADPSDANNAFKKAGDILHTMPVKKKGGKRKPRAAPVDIATTLPKRTSAAFGISDTEKQKDTTASRTSTAKTKPQPSSKGPMTIKDISKKPPVEQAGKYPSKDPSVEGAETSSKSGQSSNQSRDPKDRKVSEIDATQHLKLMTRLMSLAEGDEEQNSGAPSRAQSGKARQSRLDRAEMSARARAQEAAVIDGEPSESMETPDALLTARQGPILHGPPPTHHAYSRASSAGTRARSGISRSHSDSRQAWLPPNQDTTRTRNTHSSTSTTSEERFVRFKQGVMDQLGALDQQDMDAILYPSVDRYAEETYGGPRRTNPAYRSMGTLQRIHRKNNKVGPLRSELPPIHMPKAAEYDDPDDPRLKVLLEELYKDKKYMDKTLRDNSVENEFVRSRALEGRSFLLNRARFWSTQQTLVRPGTQAASRSSTAVPPPYPGEGTFRTRSEERPGERHKD